MCGSSVCICDGPTPRPREKDVILSEQKEFKFPFRRNGNVILNGLTTNEERICRNNERSATRLDRRGNFSHE